jgi:hypothetical protein
MCFSATASFAAGAILIPAGAVALAQAWRGDRRYLLLAAFPALFGVQQMFEGWLWLSLAQGAGGDFRLPAMGFLFFAYLFWLVATPLAALLVEATRWRRRAFLAMAAFGMAYGLSLYAPLLITPEWLELGVVRGSVVYVTRLIYGDAVPVPLLRLTYATVICLPLLASSVPAVRTFGVLVTLSVVVSFWFAAYAFTSVWCYLAAVVSAYVVLMMFRLPRPEDGAAAEGGMRNFG